MFGFFTNTIWIVGLLGQAISFKLKIKAIYYLYSKFRHMDRPVVSEAENVIEFVLNVDIGSQKI